jgi:TetR/AcrR family transcriptional regulator, regulator of autoinduction and epiphytic fitness
MSRSASPVASLADARRRGLLDAAVTVFARYGYRKTSMEEVARAAQVSRQGLYLHFATKDALFRAAVTNLLAGSLQAATAVLRDGALPLEERLVRAFDEWVGRYVGMFGAAASDLAPAAGTLIGPVVAEHEGLFAEAVTRAITAGRLAAAYRRAGLGARQLADTLLATARGLKHSSETRQAFGRAMTVAVRVMCAPLAEAR